MAKKYVEVQAGSDAAKVFMRAYEDYHDDLAAVGATFDVFMAYDVDSEGVVVDLPGCLSHGGTSAAAYVKISGSMDRASERADFTIVVDGILWDSHLSDASKLALADHEMTHVEPRYGRETGEVLRDVYGRPRLSLRAHDAEIGVFREVMERHGKEALDYQNAAAVGAMARLTCGEDGED